MIEKASYHKLWFSLSFIKNDFLQKLIKIAVLFSAEKLF
jgi:hypothetical protein